MVYYLHGKTLEEIPSTVLPETLYPDLHDLRNYAITYVYPNGEVEQVLRTVNYDSMYKLFKNYIKNQSIYRFLFLKKIRGNESIMQVMKN